MARVLFIVDRDHPELLASLQQEFATQEAAVHASPSHMRSTIIGGATGSATQTSVAISRASGVRSYPVPRRLPPLRSIRV